MHPNSCCGSSQIYLKVQRPSSHFGDAISFPGRGTDFGSKSLMTTSSKLTVSYKSGSLKPMQIMAGFWEGLASQNGQSTL